MSNKIKIGLAVFALALAFASGRYSVQKPTIKTTETAKIDTHLSENKDSHVVTTITTKKHPDGETDTIQVIDATTKVHEIESQQAQSQITQTITPPKIGTLNVSALVGNDFSSGLLKPIYGVSITKEILGPLTIGAFGFNNGLLGVSVGINF